MIWLTWRQFRAQALSVAALLVVLLAGLALTWAQVSDKARDTGFTGCRPDACPGAARVFTDALPDQVTVLYVAGTGLLIALPLLLGVFWGAPLVARELEAGTHRLIFTQSVSRHRWLLAKLSVGAVAAALGAGLTSLVLTGWAAPIDRANGNRIEPLIFAARGIVPIGAAVLAFVVGVTGGLLVRRTLAAMAVTLVVVAAVQAAVLLVLPALLVRPVTTVTPLDLGESFTFSMDESRNVDIDTRVDVPGAWIMSKTTVTPDGAEFTAKADASCVAVHDVGGLSDGCRAWLAKQDLRQRVTYLPGSHFWALQWRELGVLLVLALLSGAFSRWLIGHRLT